MIESSDGCSEVATQDRLLRRGRDAARQAMFDQIRGLYDAGHACYGDRAEAGSRSPARLSLGASHRPAGAECHGAETLHAGLLRGFPGTQLGRRDDQSPASVF